MRGFQILFEPLLAMADVGGAGIVGAVGEPHGDVAAFQAGCDFNAVAGVLQGGFTDGGIGIAERSVFVVLVLKQIGINRAGLHAILGGEFLDLVGTGHTVGKSQSTCRATVGQTPVSR